MFTFLVAFIPNSGMRSKPEGKVISALQYSNTSLPNDVRLFGNTILSSDVQLLNAHPSISIIESGNRRFVNSVQSLNAYSPILVTESCIVIFFKFFKFANALFPIFLIPLFIITFSILSPSSSPIPPKSGIVFNVDGKEILFKLLHSLKR